MSVKGPVIFAACLGAACSAQPLPRAVSVAAGFEHTCAVVAGGAVRCWGMNRYGQLGDGNVRDAAVPIAARRPGAATGISAGGMHTCALAAGAVWCWGLGAGLAAPVAGLLEPVALAVGAEHACAAVRGGVACWGRNGYGQIGDGSVSDAAAPILVPGLRGAVAIAAGAEHTCALLPGGAARCWGRNHLGQLGDGTTEDRAAPVPVLGVRSAVAIAAGGAHTCALFATGAVRCWGNNASGQLGDGEAGGFRAEPAEVPGVDDAISLAAGGDHTCAVLRDGTLRCWGMNDFGQIGDGRAGAASPVPTVVRGIAGARAASAGGCHTCALLADGRLRCWGRNHHGQIGDGTRLDRAAPVDVLWAR